MTGGKNSDHTSRHNDIHAKIRSGVFPVDIQLFNWNNSSYVQERTTANDITTETHIYMTRHLEKLREIHFDTLDTKAFKILQQLYLLGLLVSIVATFGILGLKNIFGEARELRKICCNY